MLLEDFHLQEKLAQFNRERIPSRVVHARGMGAKVRMLCGITLWTVPHGLCMRQHLVGMIV